MNATIRFIVWGRIPVGQIVGGAIGGLFAFPPVFQSPVRSLRRIEDAQPES